MSENYFLDFSVSEAKNPKIRVFPRLPLDANKKKALSL
jgi:hypothetical protein